MSVSVRARERERECPDDGKDGGLGRGRGRRRGLEAGEGVKALMPWCSKERSLQRVRLCLVGAGEGWSSTERCRGGGGAAGGGGGAGWVHV